MPYYRRNLYILSTTIFLAAISWNQIMPFLPLFLKSMGIKGADLKWWIGMVFSVQAVASIIAQPFWGKLGDSYGRKPMIIRAGLFLTCIYYGMSFCQTPWQLALFRFLNGALTGFIPGSITLIATNTPQEKTPSFVATSQVAASAGLIVGPAIGSWLADSVGYRGSMRVSGTAVLISTLFVWLFVKEPNKVNNVEKTSLLQDFAISLRSPVLAAVLFTAMVATVFGSAISPFLALHLLEIAGSHFKHVGLIFSLPAIAFVLTARFWTRFGERLGYHYAIIIGLAGGGVGAILLALPHNIWVFAGLYFIVGIILASIGPATSALICTKIEESFRGRAYGMQNAAATLGAFAAPLAASYFAAQFGISSVFIFVGVAFLIGSPIFWYMTSRWNTKTSSETSAESGSTTADTHQ